MASIDIFLDPKTLQDHCANFGAAQHSFKANVQAAMMTAMANGLRRATQSTAGQSGPDVRFVISTLNQLGYDARVQGTTLTVIW